MCDVYGLTAAEFSANSVTLVIEHAIDESVRECLQVLLFVDGINEGIRSVDTDVTDPTDST